MLTLPRFASAAPAARRASHFLRAALLISLACGAPLGGEAEQRGSAAATDNLLATNDTGHQMNGPSPALQLLAEQPGATCSFTGSFAAGDPTQNGRLFRDGVPDTCSATGTCSVFTTTGARRYRTHTVSNTTNSSQCMTATLSTSCTGTQFIYAAAYLGSFNPTNLCQNWIADSGDSPNPSISFSFNVPAGASVVIVVHELDPNAGCSSYNLDVTNCSPPPTCSFTGSIAAGNPTQTGRLFRDGVPDTCAASGSCAVTATTGARRYRTHTVTNTSASAQCMTATLSTSCTGTQFIYAAAYLGSFNPANLCENWIADAGDSPNPSVSFSFNVPAGATVVIVVHEVDPNTGCASYTLDVANCTPPPTCNFTGSIAAGDPTQTGRLFRDGVPDTCAATGSCTVSVTTGARRYRTHSVTNTTGSPQCMTANLSTSCTGTQFIFAAAYLGSFNPGNLCQNWLADAGDSPNPSTSFSFTVPAGATAVIVVHEVDPNTGCSSYNLGVTGCSSTLAVNSAVSRKAHGAAGQFFVPLPLTAPAGIESRSGGATRDHTIILTVSGAGPISVTGSPQAQVTSGSATIGSNGAANGGAVTVSGSAITIPLTGVTNAQSLAVTLNGVTDGTTSRSVTVPMRVLLGDSNGDGVVNSGDAIQTRARAGQAPNDGTYRSDVNVDGVINSGDALVVRSNAGNSVSGSARENDR